MTVWKCIDGTEVTLEDLSLPEDSEVLVFCMQEAIATIKGKIPSINSPESIDELINFVDIYYPRGWTL